MAKLTTKLKNPIELDFGLESQELKEEAKEALQEEASVYNDRQSWEEHDERIRNSRQNREERKKYANGLFYLTCAWLIAVLLILVHVGNSDLKLSDSVIITLITTSTASVVGIFIIVVNYLFK